MSEVLDAARSDRKGSLGAWVYEGDAGIMRGRFLLLLASAQALRAMNQEQAAERVKRRAGEFAGYFSEEAADLADKAAGRSMDKPEPFAAEQPAEVAEPKKPKGRKAKAEQPTEQPAETVAA